MESGASVTTTRVQRFAAGPAITVPFPAVAAAIHCAWAYRIKTGVRRVTPNDIARTAGRNWKGGSWLTHLTLTGNGAGTSA